MSDKLRLAVFLSGGGSNFEAIAKSCAEGNIRCEIAVVVTNRLNAYGLVRAKKLGLPTVALDDRHFATRASHEAALLKQLAAYDYEMIALAGYMRMMTAEFIARHHCRRFDLPGIVNIHPADAAAYQGVHGYEFAMGLTEKGSRLDETKITVHFIDTGMDTGPVIAQRPVPVLPDDDLEALKARGLAIEWELYSEVLDAIARGRVRMQNGRVIVEA